MKGLTTDTRPPPGARTLDLLSDRTERDAPGTEERAAAEGADRSDGTRRGRPGESRMDIPRDDTGRKRRRYALIGLGVAALAALTVFVANLDPAAPSVERDVLLFGEVQRGSFVRQVRGPGTLVPERVVFVSAVAGGRVDEVMAEPGAEVAESAVLLQLSNPDVELEALQAQQQLTAARANLVQLRRNLRSEVLTQEAAVADAEAVAAEARRQAAADSVLVERELISRNEASRTAEEARAAEVRLETEQRRLELLEETVDEEIGVQEEQVERLRSIQAYQRRRVESMTVRAPAEGVLQDLNLEVGQWVQSGTTLARVAQPGRLKAEIRIPETQARDVQIGQEALVDLRTDSVPGRVRRVDPNVQNGSVLVEVTLDEELPTGARPDLSVDGTIVIERLEDVLHVERPAYGQSNATVSLFRLADGGDAAERVTVRLGRSSVNRIEVVDGLREGDRIILTDMSRWDDADRVRIE